MTTLWERAILLVDMNAFFASVEQRDFPELRARPLAVTNGVTGTCIITSSYEARSQGIKTGMRLKEARLLCPDLIQRPARPRRYAEVSTRIMSTLADQVSPDIEIFSVDEAFLDITSCQRILGTPEAIAHRTKKAVLRASGLLCSVGVSGDKTTAKWAAKQHKPDGLTVIHPRDAESALANVPVQDLCGIARGTQQFLNERGVYTCGDMKNLPISVLGQRFGNIGRRLWLMAHGNDPDKLHCNPPPPKSVGHGKVLPPNTKDKNILKTYLLHMSEKVGARLRKHELHAEHFFIALRSDQGSLKTTVATTNTNDGNIIYRLCLDFLQNYWDGRGISGVQVTAQNPLAIHHQGDFFYHQTNVALHQTVDGINNKFGTNTLLKARLLQRSDMPDVIAPAWKPSGHRQTIG